MSTRLDEIEARANAATEGPWEHWNPRGTWNHAVFARGEDLANDNEGVWYTEEDAEFIAHARTDVPWLVEQVRALQAENQRLRSMQDGINAACEARDEARGQRDAAREQVRQRDETIERVQALAEKWDDLATRAHGRNDLARAEVREWCADDLRAVIREGLGR